jgi:undecaprenyl diphosphate synthase
MNPQHIAIIPDGNGRWARVKGLSRIEGHKEGIKRIKEIIDASIEYDIKALTIYVFSLENWKRPKLEVNALMDLLSFYLKTEMNDLAKKDIQFKAIGEIEMFSPKLRNLIEKFEKITLSML